MKLKSALAVKPNGRVSEKPIYKGEQMGFNKLSRTPKALSRDLSPQIIRARWLVGIRDEEKLFAARKYRLKKGKPTDENDYLPGGDFEGCSQEYINILKFGTNQELIDYDINKEART